MNVPVSSASRSAKKRRLVNPISVLESLRSDSGFHEAILQRMQVGIAKADANVFAFPARMAGNLLRFLWMNDEIAHVLIEHGFEYTPKGIQLCFEKYCASTRSTIRVLLTRGYKRDLEIELDLVTFFEVNPKSASLAYRVAENFQASYKTLPMFSMSELIEAHVIRMSQFDTSDVTTTLFLFWDPSTREDMLEDEVKVYLGKPLSIDDTKTQIECEWVQEIGRFTAAPALSTGIVPANGLPVGPAIEPTVTPRAGR